MDVALTCFLNPSGLSKAGREYFRLLDDYGARVVPVWLLPPEDWRASISPGQYERMVGASILPLGEDFVQIHTGLPNAIRRVKGARAVAGSVVFEGNIPSADQAKGCGQMDVVMTPSTFCRNACLAAGMSRKRVWLVPYPLDISTWHPGVEPTIPRSDRFRFLYVNTWYERKGWDVLLRAWWQEFSRDDPVELVVKSYREDDRDEKLEVLIELAASRAGVRRERKAPITVMDVVSRDDEMPSLVRSHDAVVSPHRSEGFGLNVWYAMALGVPVVCTDYGGTRDFAFRDTAWLVGHGRGRPSEATCRRFPELSGVTWAEPDSDSLRRAMRDCAGNEAERLARAERGARFVARRYSDARVLEDLAAALDAALPGSWAAISSARGAEALVRQGCDRYSGPGRPIRMAEI